MASKSDQTNQGVLLSPKPDEGPPVPDGLQAQIALDQLATEGSGKEILALLARAQGIDISKVDLDSIPVKYEKGTEADFARLNDASSANTRVQHIGTLDTVNNVSNDYILKAIQEQRPKANLRFSAKGLGLDAYEYKSLDVQSQEIRLLRLGGNGDDGGFDRLSIEHYPLDAVPTYRCLSYVWGNPERSLPVNCDGKSLLVTQNLYHALCASFGRYPEMHLWADGLCINQEDLNERAQQVRLMGKIYSRCETALAHLGHPKPSAQKVKGSKANSVAKPESGGKGLQGWKQRLTSRLRSKGQEPTAQLSQTGDSAKATKQGGSKGDGEAPGSIDDKTALRSAISLMNYMVLIWKQFGDFEPIPEAVWAKAKLPSRADEGKPIWEKLLSFWEEDWFQRTWVIPECVLSPKMAVLYGDLAISLDAVMEFWDLASKRGLPIAMRHGNLGDVFDIIRRTSPMTTFLALRQRLSKTKEGDQGVEASKAPNKKVDLLEVLALCRMDLASDNRDKIYAMLDIADDNIARSIIPNYHSTHSVADAFIDLATRYIRADRAPELLEQAGRNRKLTDLPSWVPDWTAQSRSALRTRRYFCARDTSPQISLYGNDSTLLAVRAAVWANIPPTDFALGIPWRSRSSGKDKYNTLNSPLMPSASFQTDPNEIPFLTTEEARIVTMKQALKIADSISEVVNEHYPEGYRQAVARTLCADCSWSGERLSSPEALASFMESFEAFSNFYSRLVGPKEVPGLRAKYPSKTVYPTGTSSWLVDCSNAELDARLCQIMPFAMALQEAQIGRRFAMLAGGLLALVPADTETGDYIILIEGANMPFVVRPVDLPSKLAEDGNELRAFELVGDCYVHGIMDGEMLCGGAEDEDPKAIVRGRNGRSYVGKWPTKDRYLAWEKILLR